MPGGVDNGYLQVRNWSRYQNADVFKKSGGRPPWVKLYAAVLDDVDFAQLTDAEVGQLFKIWILAARTGNKLSTKPGWIRSRIGATRVVPVSKFLSLGFLEPYDSATNPAANGHVPSRHARDSVETESRLEVDVEVEDPPTPLEGGSRKRGRARDAEPGAARARDCPECGPVHLPMGTTIADHRRNVHGVDDDDPEPEIGAAT